MEEKFNGNVKKYLDTAIDKKASDLHLTVGIIPMLRIDGRLVGVPGEAVLTTETNEKLVKSLMNTEQNERLAESVCLSMSDGTFKNPLITFFWKY